MQLDDGWVLEEFGTNSDAHLCATATEDQLLFHESGDSPLDDGWSLDDETLSATAEPASLAEETAPSALDEPAALAEPASLAAPAPLPSRLVIYPSVECSSDEEEENTPRATVVRNPDRVVIYPGKTYSPNKARAACSSARFREQWAWATGAGTAAS